MTAMSRRRSGWHRRRPTPADAVRAAQYNNPAHKALRAALLASLVPGQPCPQVISGVPCGKPMFAWQPLDLGHTDDRTGYIGLVHRACNRRAAAIKANKTRVPARPSPARRSRIW